MKKLIIVVLGLLISLSVSAQQQISGTIVDDDGQPILGAFVTIPGTSQSTTTTFDGSFRLELDTQIEQIQIDYLGYNNKLVYIDTDEIIHDLGTIKMTLNYKDRFAKKSNFIFISAQTAIPSLGGIKPAFGAMIGWSKKVGVYAKALFSKPASENIMQSNDVIYFSDNSIKSYNYFGIGILIKLCKYIYLNTGLGTNWGNVAVQSALTDKYYIVEDLKYRNIGIDAGAMFKFGHFTFNTGIIYTINKGCAGNFGIGLCF